MKISQEYLPISQRRSGEKNLGITYIVCHDTAGDGATAQNEVDYYIKSADDIQASAHAFVDDLGVIECIPLDEKAWGVRYSAGIAPNIEGNYANDHAVHVELCYSTYESFDSKKAYQNYCAYIASLCIKYRLDTTKLVQHAKLDPTRRTDPINAFSKIGVTWEMFLKDVSALINVPISNNNKHMIQYIKFYMTGSDVVKTLDMATMAFESEGATHNFTSPEDAVARTESIVLIFWDGKEVGTGSVIA